MKYIKLLSIASLGLCSTAIAQTTDSTSVQEKTIPQVTEITEIFAPPVSNTGGNTTISSKEISKRPVNNIAGAMEGIAPGVEVSGSPNDPRIIIRGLGTLNGGSDPLVIVDGAPYSGPLNSINPNDVKEIKVLKDAVSKGRYGARGANGVILITTKTYEHPAEDAPPPRTKKNKKGKSQ